MNLVGFDMKSVVAGAYYKRQMRLPLLLLGFGFAACLALYVLFSDPVGTGIQWSKFSGGGRDVGDRKTGNLAATANHTSIITGQPRSSEPEAPVVTNTTKKGNEDMLPPLSPVPSNDNLSPDERIPISTENDNSRDVSQSPPPPITATIPLNASSSDPTLPPTVASADAMKEHMLVPTPPSAPQDHDKELLAVLQRASMGNKTVIITTLNEAWAVPNSVVDLFFESFRIGEGTQGLLKHLVIIAMDPKAYERCNVIHPHCYLMVTEGMDFSREELFMTPDYMTMMWRRLQFLGSILELGFSFIFTDTDIMWFRNPFLHFDPTADISIACDHYVGDPYNLYNGINGGFYYARSNPLTVEFYKYWYRSRWEHPENNEQDVFNMIKGDDFTNKLGIKIRYLDTIYFSGFCEPTKYFGQVITMHANCCIGLQKKLDDLRLVLEDWGNYTKLSPEERRYTHTTWRIPKSC